jgi:putative ABC transport system permease protein
MSLWKIAWRSIQQRSLASTLTAISMALGVALVVTVLVLHDVIDQSFRRGAQGYDMIVGAKGGQLELVLSTAYNIGRPIENIPYNYYEELLPGGRFAAQVETAIPVCLGDSYEGFLVIGTLPERFTKLHYLDGRNYEFAEGRNFEVDHFYEAVIGAYVSQQTGLKIGGEMRPTHGVAEKGEAGHKHRPFQVVGILAPTGTPLDRNVFVNMEGFYHLEGHSHHSAGHDADTGSDHADHDHDHVDSNKPVPEDAKRVTAVLVCTEPTAVMTLAKQINEGATAQAALPAQVMIELLDGIVGNVQVILLLLAVLVVVVAGIGILVSIYNSMSDRRREIAIMRALGARRWTVMLVILLESILLAQGGGALGLLLGHGMIGALGPTILEYTGIAIGTLHFSWTELVLVPGLVVLAALVGYLPAVIAYRTDVAQAL